MELRRSALRYLIVRYLVVGLLLTGLVAGCGPWPVAHHPPRAVPPEADYHEVFADHSEVFGWMQVLLDTLPEHPPHPTVTSWRIHVLTAAMYEAWAAYDPVAVGPVLGGSAKRPALQRTPQNQAIAVNHAAFTALVWLYPASRERFERVMTSVLGLPLDDTIDADRPAGLGNLAALRVIEDRLDDGARAREGFAAPEGFYTPVNRPDPDSTRAPGGSNFDPNRWQPLRVPTGTVRDRDGQPLIDPEDHRSYVDQEYLTPHWGEVRPFGLDDGAQLRPPPPPLYGSDAPYVDGLGRAMTSHEAWLRQHRELIDVQVSLTDEQKVIAELWEDGPRTWTPPGHWVQLALGLCLRDEHGLEQDVKMFYALGGALLDAGIAVWDAKLYYDFVRPVSAIRHVFADEPMRGWQGPREGVVPIQGEQWHPYQSLDLVSPPFPEYPSGHSGFSHAAAETLASFTGTDRFYDGVTVVGEDVTASDGTELLGTHRVRPGGLRFQPGPAAPVELRWDTLSAAAEQSARSRIYGGIHILDGDLRARAMGREAGRLAYTTAQGHWEPVRVARGALAHSGLAPATIRSWDALLTDAEEAQRAGDTPTACRELRRIHGQLRVVLDDLAPDEGGGPLVGVVEALDGLESGWCPT